MNKKFIAFYTAATVFSITQTASADEALQLTNIQMDSITAGAASVDIGVQASAMGNNSSAITYSTANAQQYNSPFATINVAYGYGVGTASGNGGSMAGVSVNSSANGDYSNANASTNALSSPYGSVAYGWGSAISVTLHP